MKKQSFLYYLFLALALFFLGRNVAKCQIGANYVNLDTYGDSLSMVWMCEASDCIVPIRLRTDKEQSTVLDVATLDKAKQFHDIALSQGKQAEICYTVNLWATPQTNLEGVKILKDYGCNVPIIEVGNEYFAIIKKEYGVIDFKHYQPLAENLRSVLSSAYPDLIFVYPAYKAEEKNWNEALNEMLQKYPNDSYTWHVYYTKYDAPILSSLPTKQALNGFNSYLEGYFESYYNSCLNSDLFERSLNYADSLFKRKGYFTEYGTVESGTLRNTIAYGSLVFRDGVKYKDRTYLYIHSGIAKTGVIMPRDDKFDLDSSNLIKRVEYYALKLANECVNALPLSEVNYLHEGVNYFYFTGNVNAGFSGNFKTTFETRLVKGEYLYLSAGATYFMGNGTAKSNDIKGIEVFEGVYTPGNSFGYVKVVCLPLDVVGCTDILAENYNPDANVNEGCVYPICLKKRWLFKSLPCKISNNKICNCN